MLIKEQLFLRVMSFLEFRTLNKSEKIVGAHRST